MIPFRGQLALFGGLDDKNQAVEGAPVSPVIADHSPYQRDLVFGTLGKDTEDVGCWIFFWIVT